MVEEDERLNKVKIAKKRKKKKTEASNDMAQKELCKIYFKVSIII